MEIDVSQGIELFKSHLASKLHGATIVIPVRPTGGAFLVSVTHQGFRTYLTIHEDDFADWGDKIQTKKSMSDVIEDCIKKINEGLKLQNQKQ